MKPGSTVWTSSYGNVQRGKLIAIDGMEAAVRWDGGSFVTVDLSCCLPSKNLALVASLKYRMKDLANQMKSLNEQYDRAKKSLADVLESLNVTEA